MRQSLEASLETRQLRRMRAEDRYLTRLERLEKLAEPLVGELCREGKTVYYVVQLDRNGRRTGKYIENTSQYALVDFLIRNKYVH
jgi:hypothetical protein